MAEDKPTTRVCKKCGQSKEIEEFTKGAGGKPIWTCKKCTVARQVAWARANRETVNKRLQAWADANRERVRGQKNKWRENNPDRQRLSASEYYRRNRDEICAKINAERNANKSEHLAQRRKEYAANPELWKIRQARYEARHPEEARAARSAASARRRSRINASTVHFSREDVQALYKTQKGKCAFCRKRLRRKYHADHIDPLARGGSNGPENIQLLCPKCNLRKHAKDPYEWAQENGRLF